MQRDLEAKKYIVITSINPMNEALEQYALLSGWKLILVGDIKGPKEIEDERIIFLDIEKQGELGFSSYINCPENHYSRKNIGYLYAISHGAEIIAETDDDNIPLLGWGDNIKFNFDEVEVIENTKFFNVYSEFTDFMVWPRGFPLERILNPEKFSVKNKSIAVGVIQQLADDDPDVDAIYRLTRGEPIKFKTRKHFALGKNVYCPFNSQNTFWARKSFPFLYLPISVTFRFTDILRGYIAQRLLWEENLHLMFGGASVRQERNEHDLMRDFIDEIPVYTELSHIVNKMETIELYGSPIENLIATYRMLLTENIVKKSEIIAINSWAEDLRKLGFN